MDLYTIKIILLLSIPFFMATTWAMVNAAQKEFSSVAVKITWILVAGIPFVGFVIYLLLGYRKGRRPALKNTN